MESIKSYTYNTEIEVNNTLSLIKNNNKPN